MPITQKTTLQQLADVLRKLATLCESDGCAQKFSDEDVKPFYLFFLQYYNCFVDKETIKYMSGKSESSVRSWLCRNVLRRYNQNKVKYKIKDVSRLIDKDNNNDRKA